MTGRRVATTTQELNPRSTVVRSTLLALLAALPIMNGALAIIVEQLRPYGEVVPGWVFGILNGGIVATALAISIGTKIMAMPGFNDWLRKHAAWLAPEDKPRGIPEDTSGRMGALAGLAVLALVLVTALPAGAASITYPYTAHVQSVGWQGMVGDGVVAGTTGKGLRLEAVRFVWPGQQSRGHVQDIGWQGWQAGDSTEVGTTGKGKRLEAVQVRSTIPGVHIECQAHVQGKGWLARVRDGQVCGTTGKGLRLEAVRLWLIDKN